MTNELNTVDVDTIQFYEVHSEICWESMGYINNYLECDHIILCLNEKFQHYTEYDYYANQFADIEQNDFEVLDFGNENITQEEANYEYCWFADSNRFDDLYDFFDGSIVDKITHPETGDIYFEYRCDLCNKNQNMYTAKYKCWSDVLSFIYCNKECCSQCSYNGIAKFLNKGYMLNQKYVQPIE